MEITLIIVWAIGTMISYFLLSMQLQYKGLCNMFPEGKRWFDPILEFLYLAIFVQFILINPYQ